MGYKGPVLRARFIGTELTEIQLLLYSLCCGSMLNMINTTLVSMYFAHFFLLKTWNICRGNSLNGAKVFIYKRKSSRMVGNA
jgi:hypothetical protein